MTLYVVVEENEEAAMQAVRGAVPLLWKVDEVITVASDDLVHRRGLLPGRAEQL